MPSDFSRLLHSTNEKCFSENIKVDPDLEKNLRSARDEIRDQIRAAFGPEHQFSFADRSLHEASRRLTKPKFRLQGSFSYSTHIQPAHTPPQQIDIDDGMFLPVSFVTQDGAIEPSFASDVVFLLVEKAVEPLCNRKGWKLEEKESCVRIILSEQAHIDIALYAVPDGEFATLVEKAASDSQANRVVEKLDERVLLDEAYAQLGSDHVLLAVRNKGWRKSDPRKLEDWFNAAVKDYGPQLRRVCRYLKAWRDFGDDKPRLASIALMAIAVDTYRTKTVQQAASDADALYAVVQALPAALNKDIPNPVVEGELLNQAWSTEERKKFVSDAQLLLASLTRSFNLLTSPEAIIDELRGRLGERVPDNPAAVKVDACSSEKKSLSAVPLAVPALQFDKAALAGALDEARASKVVSKPYAAQQEQS